MKKIILLLTAVSILFSCASKPVSDPAQYSVSRSVSVSLGSFKYNLKKVVEEKQRFVPIQKNHSIAQAVFAFTNEADAPFEPLDDSVIELVCLSPDNSLQFFPAEDPFAVSFTPLTMKPVREKKNIAPFTSSNITYYFVYPQKDKPVFISFNRTSVINLLLNDDASLLTAMEHYAYVETAVSNAQHQSFEEIDVFMKEYAVAIDETDSRNKTMLISAIVSHNDDLFESLVIHGADIFKKTTVGGYSFTPLHAAVLSCNAFALDVLISKGAVLENGSGNSPASLAVKMRNIEALEFLAGRGYDFSALKIRDDVFTDKLFTPLIYARRNSYSDVEQFFLSVSERE